MITLKDIIDLNPYCNVSIHNNKYYNFVDIYKHPEEYIISDMYAYDDRLDVLVNKKDEFELKFNKYGYECAGLGIEKLFGNNDVDDIDVGEDLI